MITHLKNIFLFRNKYKTHPNAVIISCFFNPQNSQYRLKAFNIWYDTIKHLNHRIIECIIGDSKPQLPENKNIKRIYTENLLWHKESLLNNIISELPKKYKYVFWVDADILFTNLNWLYHGSKFLKKCNMLQPFEYCIHLEKDELKPNFDIEKEKKNVFQIRKGDIRLWRSFCANYVTTNYSDHQNYNLHGFVGFCHGYKREILDKVPLYDKCLSGGADHIFLHAGAGHIPNSCITNAFKDNIEEINEWSKKFYEQVQGKISFVEGDVYHIYHGDINKRRYFQRILDFTKIYKDLKEKDENGLYIGDEKTVKYIHDYFLEREIK